MLILALLGCLPSKDDYEALRLALQDQGSPDSGDMLEDVFFVPDLDKDNYPELLFRTSYRSADGSGLAFWLIEGTGG